MSWCWGWNIGRRAVLIAAILGTLAASREAFADDSVATVNGRPIPAAELEFLYLVRRVPEERRSELKDRFVEDLIDQRLMADFLASRRTEATKEDLDARVASLRAMIERDGRKADEVLAKLGITDDMLRKTLAQPLAWRQHVRRVVTEDQLQAHFAAHRARLDGTRRRISQIVRTLPAEADDAARQAALEVLRPVQADIAVGKITFAAAAEGHSQSPSKAQGGDMGWAVYGTRLPKEIADVAFQLPVGQVSEPFLTRFGAHLLLVTEEEPGDLSLEDVRDEVLAELGRNLWTEQLKQERATAKIERSPAP